MPLSDFSTASLAALSRALSSLACSCTSTGTKQFFSATCARFCSASLPACTSSSHGVPAPSGDTRTVTATLSVAWNLSGAAMASGVTRAANTFPQNSMLASCTVSLQAHQSDWFDVAPDTFSQRNVSTLVTKCGCSLGRGPAAGGAACFLAGGSTTSSGIGRLFRTSVMVAQLLRFCDAGAARNKSNAPGRRRCIRRLWRTPTAYFNGAPRAARARARARTTCVRTARPARARRSPRRRPSAPRAGPSRP